jgi:predicted phage-related endonuclease
VDRVWVKKGTRQPVALLEVKTTSARAAGLSNSELVERYYQQLQWYMGVTGVDMCELAVLIGGQELRHLSVDFDYATFPEMAWTVDDWWQKHIIGDTPPAVVAADNPRLNLTPAEPVEAVIADTGMEHELDRLRELRQRIKTDSDEASWIEAQIKATLGHATELRDPAGTILATWREQASTRLDSKKLKTEQPELWQQYATTPTSRVLRLSKGAES